jgi:hypothetical protein
LIGKIIIRDSPTIATIGKNTVKSPRFVHEIFRNAFPPIIDGLLVKMLPDAEQYVKNYVSRSFLLIRTDILHFPLSSLADKD